MSIRIRDATNQDMPAIVRMIGEFRLDYEDLQPSQFIVAQDGELMVGFGRLKPYPDATEIECIGVLHERRREGIGKLIVDELIRRGPGEIWITTVMPEFFRPMGFVESSEVPESIVRKLERFRDFKRGRITAMRHRKPPDVLPTLSR
jgi:N-acetylglutamate synthase-like GNAT family acetyltransferase